MQEFVSGDGGENGSTRSVGGKKNRLPNKGKAAICAMRHMSGFETVLQHLGEGTSVASGVIQRIVSMRLCDEFLPGFTTAVESS